jgi:hypothetical protein
MKPRKITALARSIIDTDGIPSLSKKSSEAIRVREFFKKHQGKMIFCCYTVIEEKP